MKRCGLSKSKLLSSLQCAKRLWLEVHRADLMEVSAASEQRFAIGHHVGQVARDLHPRGVLIASEKNPAQALIETRDQLKAGRRLLFEPAFHHDGVLIRADVLTVGRAGVRINEVKASTEVKPYHINDAAIQAWVIEQSGLKLDSISIQHIDTRFVYSGDLKYEGLFAKVPVNREIKPLVKQVPKWVSAARNTLDGPEPKKEMGSHCSDPYSCPFTNHCESLAPQTKFPLKLLPNFGKSLPGILAQGFRDLRDIPQGTLSDKQERVRRAHVENAMQFDPAVKKFMRGYQYPRAYLDFETINFAVPIWKGVRPYQQIAFQWSLHVEGPRARIRHREYLDLSGKLPAAPLLMELIEALPGDGPIFAYGAGFEKSCLGTLADLVPARKRVVERVQARLVDLLPLTRNHYYHPRMEGSWSLKAVFPTIPGGKHYSDLEEVNNGGGAQSAYAEAIAQGTTVARKAALQGALLEYCKQDTEALIVLSRFLQGRSL